MSFSTLNCMILEKHVITQESLHFSVLTTSTYTFLLGQIEVIQNFSLI